MKKITITLFLILFVSSLTAQVGQSRILEVKDGQMDKFMSGVAKKTQMYNNSEDSAKFFTFQILTGPNATDFIRVRWMESINELDNPVDAEELSYWNKVARPYYTEGAARVWQRNAAASYVPEDSTGNLRRVIYYNYKDITDIYSLYASEVMMYDQINAAKIGAYQQYLRPIVCISVGLFSDKTGNINNIFFGFIVMLMGSIIFASGIVSSSLNILFIVSLIIVATGTYAIRGLYFSILNDGDIPVALSGTAIGIVSIIGYSPDIFATGGASYSIGTIFYSLDKKYAHTVWHLFVLAGSTLHFFFILFYIIFI